MVRRYTPDIDIKWYDYEESPHYSAIMEESKFGEWVKLETYLDETSQLRAEIERIKFKLENAK